LRWILKKSEREEQIVELMTLTQRLNEWTLRMQLKRIQEASKPKKVNTHD